MEESVVGGSEDERLSEFGEMFPEELEAATHAAMAAFNTSQAKLRALKPARGYFKKAEPSAHVSAAIEIHRQVNLKRRHPLHNSSDIISCW